MPLIDLTHTSHTRARTGVQRVARSLALALGEQASPICHDPYLGGWRPLEAWERANLAAVRPATKRGAQWPWSAQLRGRLGRLAGSSRKESRIPAADSLIVPEIFSPSVGAALGPLFSKVRGPRIAVFHDAIALQLPEMTPAKTVARFPGYLRELLAFDGIAAISEASRQSLADYWQWLGISHSPPIAAIPLGIEPPNSGPEDRNSPRRSSKSEGGPRPPKLAAASEGGPPRSAIDPIILCVASIEGRKNHVALLDACERLWTQGRRFELRLVGLAQPQTGRAALDRIASLQTAGRPLRYDGPVDDAALNAAYRECDFTVYPSLLEGFGLPVLESLSHGRPCVCSGRGALGEAAQGGGCLALDTVDAASLAAAIDSLLAPADSREQLAAEARARRFRSWSDYTRDLTAWMSTLPSR